MRQLIHVSHTRYSFRVVFEHRTAHILHEIVVGAESANDARKESLNLLAYHRYHHQEYLPALGKWSRESDWKVLGVDLA